MPDKYRLGAEFGQNLLLHRVPNEIDGPGQFGRAQR